MLFVHGLIVVLFAGIRQYPVTALRWLLPKKRDNLPYIEYLKKNINEQKQTKF